MGMWQLKWMLMAAVASGCNGALVDCAMDTTPIQPAYMLVEYRAGGTVGTTAPPEVQETASYAANGPAVHTIALKFPDDCLTEGAARATGTATTSREIMGTRCGVWLAELERALTEQHYKVISWSALRQQQETHNISTYDAARELGADVVFGVNSMETHPILRGSQSTAITRYFTSDARGNRLAKVAPEERDRPGLKRFAAEHAGALGVNDVVGFAATLDVTAVLASSGESIWFFRHAVSQPRDVATGMRFLFERDRPADDLTPVRPEGLPEAPRPEVDRSTEDVDRTTRSAAPEDLYQAELHKLARDVANECVIRFHGGKR